MKPGQGKAKGGAFERAIAVQISLWLSRGLRRDLLIRSEGSGARFTSSFNRSGVAIGTAGDLAPVDPLAFPLCNKFDIEAKHWKSLDMHLFLQGQGPLYTALAKVRRQAEQHNKLWWLVARQNHRPTLLFMPAGVLYILNGVCHSLFNGSVTLVNFDYFLANVEPESICG